MLTVRNTLFALDGIEDVQASSAFKTVKVTFDSRAALSSQIIVMALLDAGYAPAGFNGSVINVPVSNGKADPGWTVLATRDSNQPGGHGDVGRVQKVLVR